MKPERWGSPLVQEKYQEENTVTRDIITITTTTIIIIIIIIIINVKIQATYGFFSGVFFFCMTVHPDCY